MVGGGGRGVGPIRGIAWTAMITCVGLTGCRTGSLASDTGPTRPWSSDDQQFVHVGEHVDFSFAITAGVLHRRAIHPFGIADYCIATAGSEVIEADLDETGHYRFGFDAVDLHPGDVVTVTATAYRRRGVRDSKRIGGRWIHADSRFDQPDGAVAYDTLDLRVYESLIDLRIVHPPADIDMDGGRLEIVKDDGTTATVLAAGPDGRGFHYAGPDAESRYHVTYEPTADQINKSGRTYVRFIVFDGAGDQHTFDGYVPTL